MPDEFRRITFAHAEVQEAISRPETKPVKGHLGGDVTALTTIHSNGDFLYEITVFDYAKNKESKVHFREDDLLQAIVGHCHGHDIPLPWASTKTLNVVEQNPTGTLRVIDNRLCLDVFMGEMAVAPPVADSDKKD